MKRPFTIWLLAFWLLFLALGGLYGGIAMLLDPSGAALGMTAVLDDLPVSDYILPGLFLLFAMGLFPLVLIYALLALPQWPWLEKLLPTKGVHWAWVGILALCVVLGIWLVVEGFLIGFEWPIQYVTLVNGLLIFLFALLTPVRRYCAQ
ncbi:MAG: hypothetical protein JW726_09620 [Anaerolineales bacterium]|nr:hypothetical protein [Anaerolineales bacterium]